MEISTVQERIATEWMMGRALNNLEKTGYLEKAVFFGRTI
jgi:hypothetical protein